ncbi:MAG: hypothetical protein ACI4T6_12125 [Candidatus Flemingiibacterium sp.]
MNFLTVLISAMTADAFGLTAAAFAAALVTLFILMRGRLGRK